MVHASRNQKLARHRAAATRRTFQVVRRGSKELQSASKGKPQHDGAILKDDGAILKDLSAIVGTMILQMLFFVSVVYFFYFLATR